MNITDDIPGIRYEIKREAGYYSVYDSVTGLRLVDRESLTIAENIAERANDPAKDDRTEAADVARSIRAWGLDVLRDREGLTCA